MNNLAENQMIELSRPSQLELFQSFKIGKSGHKMTNLFPIYDLIPRGIYSYKAQREMRDERGHFAPQKETFEIRDPKTKEKELYNVIFYPAQIERPWDEEKDKNLGPNGTPTDSYLLGTSEMVIEEILKYMACNPKYGACDTSNRGYSVVVSFTFREIKSELKNIGASMSIPQIRKSLEILAGTQIKIEGVGNGEFDYQGPLLTGLVLVNRNFYEKNPTARNRVKLADIIGQSLSTGAYRQADFTLLMGKDGRPSPLCNYLSKRLFIRFTNATKMGALARGGDDRGLYYDISISTLHSESKLLGNKTIYYDRTVLIRALDAMKNKGIISQWEQIKTIKDESGKVCDYIFRLTPSQSFVRSQVAANNRQRELTSILNK
jgi:hypothetical protein